MESNKKNNIFKWDILTILAVVILARLSCPALSNIPLFAMSFTFVYGISFVFIFFFTAKRIKRADMHLVFAVIVYAFYVCLRGYLAGRDLFARDSFNAYVIVFLTLIYIWLKEQPRKTKTMLIKLIFIAFIFNYVYSIIVLIFDPKASRTAAAIGVLEKSPYDILNAVGSFDAVYGGLAVVAILLYIREVFKKRNIKNSFSFIVLLLALVFIVMASYATALVLLIVTFALFLGSKNKVLSGFLIVLVLCILVFHTQFGQLVMDFSKNLGYSKIASEKMYEFGYMIKTFETAGTYAGEGGRFARLGWSWNTFLKYPLFGGVGIPGAKVGGHSEILDLLGNFGLVGFFVVVTYLFNLYKNIKAGLENSELKKCLDIIMLVFVISAVLNPSLYSLQMIPIILMISLAPSYINMCIEKRKPGEFVK